eukprot:Rmarinus@m.17556
MDTIYAEAVEKAGSNSHSLATEGCRVLVEACCDGDAYLVLKVPQLVPVLLRQLEPSAGTALRIIASRTLSVILSYSSVHSITDDELETVIERVFSFVQPVFEWDPVVRERIDEQTYLLMCEFSHTVAWAFARMQDRFRRTSFLLRHACCTLVCCLASRTTLSAPCCHALARTTAALAMPVLETASVETDPLAHRRSTPDADELSQAKEPTSNDDAGHSKGVAPEVHVSEGSSISCPDSSSLQATSHPQQTNQARGLSPASLLRTLLDAAMKLYSRASSLVATHSQIIQHRPPSPGSGKSARTPVAGPGPARLGRESRGSISGSTEAWEASGWAEAAREQTLAALGSILLSDRAQWVRREGTGGTANDGIPKDVDVCTKSDSVAGGAAARRRYMVHRETRALLQELSLEYIPESTLCALFSARDPFLRRWGLILLRALCDLDRRHVRSRFGTPKILSLLDTIACGTPISGSSPGAHATDPDSSDPPMTSQCTSAQRPAVAAAGRKAGLRLRSGSWFRTSSGKPRSKPSSTGDRVGKRTDCSTFDDLKAVGVDPGSDSDAESSADSERRDARNLSAELQGLTEAPVEVDDARRAISLRYSNLFPLALSVYLDPLLGCGPAKGNHSGKGGARSRMSRRKYATK